MASAIANIWKKRIVAGTQLFSKCPVRYKGEVKTLLLEDVENGILTEEEYNDIIGR